MESDAGTGGSGLQDQHSFLDTHLDINVCEGVWNMRERGCEGVHA